MSTYTGRLKRLEIIHTPPQRVADWSRLTPEQSVRYRDIDRRADLVGLDALTNAEIEEAAHLAEIALGVVSPGTPQPRN